MKQYGLADSNPISNQLTDMQNLILDLKTHRQGGLRSRRWLGDKIPVLWHQPGEAYLFQGSPVRKLSTEDARNVSNCHM